MRREAMSGLRQSHPKHFWGSVAFRVLIALVTFYFAVFLFLPS
jgi:hypothetical protein